MRDQYLRISQAFMLVYSVAHKSSFVELPELLEQVLRVKDIDSVPIVICGNAPYDAFS